jgi:DNA-binding transcriptional ArsR family regulator
MRLGPCPLFSGERFSSALPAPRPATPENKRPAKKACHIRSAIRDGIRSQKRREDLIEIRIVAGKFLLSLSGSCLLARTPRIPKPRQGTQAVDRAWRCGDRKVRAVLSHGFRRRLVRMINAADQPLSAEAIARKMDAPITVITYHMEVLRKANLIRLVDEVEGVRGMKSARCVSMAKRNITARHVLFRARRCDAGRPTRQKLIRALFDIVEGVVTKFSKAPLCL